MLDLDILSRPDGGSLQTGDAIPVRRNSRDKRRAVIGTATIIGSTGVYATSSAARTAFGVGTIGTQASSSVTITGGAISGVTGNIVERTLSVPAPGNVIIPVFVAARGYTINAVTIYTRSGTITADCKIGTTSITSINALSVTSTPQTVSATGANAMVAGNTLNISFASGSTPLDLHVTFKLTTA